MVTKLSCKAQWDSTNQQKIPAYKNYTVSQSALLIIIIQILQLLAHKMKGNRLPEFNRPSSLLAQSQPEDSLDDFQQQPQQYTVPAPLNTSSNPHIELTFKKSHLQQHFSYSNNDKLGRSLFTESERLIVRNLQHSIANYYKMPIDQLSRLPFADLYSLQLNERQKQKLVIVGDILQLKRVRMKAKIVRVNQKCLSLKQNLSHQEKNKIFLLDLLVRQLSKKQLIQTLRLNLKRRKFIRQFGPESNKERQQFSNPEIFRQEISKSGEDFEENVKRQQLFQQLNNSQLEEELSKDGQDADKSSIRDKIWIMSQTLSSIFMKVIFWSFSSISRHSNKMQKSIIPKHPSNSFQVSPIKQIKKQMSLKSQQIISQEKSPLSKQEIAENQEQASVAYSQAYREQSNASQTQIQLQRLQDYIDELLQQCSQTNDLQRRYFIKWKVYLLEKIAMSILTRANHEQQEREHSQYEEQENKGIQEPELESIQSPMRSRKNQKNTVFAEKNRTQLSIIQGWSRATSQLSQAYSGLKQQKNEIKTFLFKYRINQFLTLLRRNTEQKQINIITKQVYVEKILQRAFLAFKINRLNNQKLKQLDQYFQQAAQNQNQDIDLPFYFWKTSQLHKYFKLFKQNSRNIKAQRVFNSFSKRNSFKLLLHFTRKQLKQDERLNKWVALQQKKRLFRLFNAWKQQYKSNRCYSNSSKVKSYVKAKEKDVLSYYFSVLKLEYKKHLITMHRADRYYSVTLKRKILGEMKILVEDEQQFREKEQILSQCLYFRSANIFIVNFKDFYYEYHQFQRLIVKQERLKKLLSENHTAQCLKNWRARRERSRAYAAIEDRLIRLNSKKKKAEILKIWIKKALQRRSIDSDKSDKHKEWLLKYYNGLCAVSPY